ncbi:MAG TPA: SHOCT domain-containing protein [Solirubrobacterales bacterium]|nr:SHOCT domain-containing protein [Solirubrobacterales bacterium]
MKDLSSLTKQAKELQRQQQEEARYMPGFRGQIQQMGDLISQANEPVGDSGFTPAPAPAPSGDHIAELERLAKLRDSGALTDAEFEQQKAKILGS